MNDQELMEMANGFENEFVRRTRRMEDFLYDESQDAFWDRHTAIPLKRAAVESAIPRSLWPTTENRRGEVVPTSPALAIQQVETGLTVEGAVWWPGAGELIRDLVVTEKGAMEVPGAQLFNLYKAPPPLNTQGDSENNLWTNHLKRIYPEEEEQTLLLDYMAHLIQRPEQKPGFGVVLGGKQGIGKDTLLWPLRQAVGEYNSAEIGPDEILSPHNAWVQSLLIVVNEVRPFEKHYHANAFYNRLKILLASPPDYLASKEKYRKTIFVRNVCRVFLTTNDIYNLLLEENDRRMFVMNSRHKGSAEPGAFPDGYWEELWDWLARKQGWKQVAAMLAKRDLSNFKGHLRGVVNRKKADIIEMSVEAYRNSVDDLLQDFLGEFGEEKPQIIFIKDLSEYARSERFDDVDDVQRRLKGRGLTRRMNRNGYVKVPLPKNLCYWGSQAGQNFYSRAAYVLEELVETAKTPEQWNQLGEMIQKEAAGRPGNFLQNMAKKEEF